jgi:hypothetical protein
MKIWKSRKFQAAILIFSAIILAYGSALICQNHDNSIPFTELLYYTSQITSSIFVISGVVIAVWQYYLSSKSSKTNLEINRVQRAIDLSEYYKDNILNYYPAIKYIFDNTGISEITGSIRLDQLHDFDSHELQNNFSPEQIKKLREIQTSDNFVKKAIEANAIYSLNDNKIVKVSKTEEKNTIMITYVSSLTDKLLNNLEFFALHFSHQTADESVVYQSLHQTYLEIVQYMYYDIANRNTDSTSKFYTNVIWLFGVWCDKKNQQSTDRSKKSRSIQSPGTVVDV